MAQLKKSFPIKSRDFIRAGEASINVQNLLKSMDFDPRLIRRVAICGYESEMNVVMHGGDGTLSIEVDSEKLILEVTDDGPGIPDIDLAMQAGYSTANDDHREMGFGAGMGLPNMKKNSDQIQVESPENNGTFGCCTDGSFAADANAFTATDALVDNANSLLFFDPDGFGRTDPQT